MASVVRVRIAVSLCAVCLAGVAMPSAEAHASLRLVFETAGLISSAARANAFGEAARIWHRYGVSLVVGDAGGCAEPDDPAVNVVLDTGRDATSSDAGLGDIRFAADGLPDPTIMLHYDAVARVATSAPFMGLHPALWPAGLRDEVIARALGRALAHEIGHYLLRSPHHAGSGLMQARQKGSTLSNPSDRPFQLTSPEQARLQLALAAPRPTQSICPVLAQQ